MITRILDVLVSRLNEHLQSELGLPSNLVGLAPPPKDGLMEKSDRVDLTFLSIEPDPHSRNSGSSPAALNLDVRVAFSFHGESYGAALDLVYAVLEFFHRNVVFEIDAQETSNGLRVQVEQQSPSTEEVNYPYRVVYPTPAPRLDYRIRIQEM